jgi:hypothetical protein
MRVVVAAGAVAVAAGVMAGLVAACGGSSPSLQAAVTNAVAKTSAQSYSFSLDATVQFAGRDLNSSVVSGAFDPGHKRGTELVIRRLAQRSVRAQIRFVGKYAD